MRQRGFSLVELMVASTIGLIVFAALVTIFVQTSVARAEVERTSEQVENGRYAIELIAQDLQLAGFYGELNATGLPMPGALPDLCSVDPAEWGAGIPIHVQGYDEAAGLPACMTATVKPDTDVFAVRRVRTCVAGAAGCDAVVATEPYLQVSLCGNATTTYELGRSAEAAFGLTAKDCVTPAGLRRYVEHIYFVSNDNGAGKAVPTLKRLEFTGAGYSEVPLVEGVERLQMQYGLDLDGDGAPDAYTADPTSYACGGCTAVSNWSNVVTANVFVLARTSDPSPRYTDTKTYDLGFDAAGQAVRAGPFNDNFRRHVYSAAIRVMNASGRRDKP